MPPWENYQSQPQTDGPWAKYTANTDTSPKTDLFDAVSDNALQGATFGIGNRASAGLAALVASGINDKPISENYETARNVGTQRLNDEMQQHPVASIGANIGGALATGGLGAETKIGSAVADSLRSGGLPLRMLKGAGAGAVSGAAYGAGTAGYDKSLEGAEQGAVTGAVTGGAIPAAGAALSDVAQTGKQAVQGAFARSPEAVQDIAEKLKSGAGGLYDQMRNAGATFKQSATQGFLLPDIDSAISKNNFIPALNPKTTAVIDDLKQKAATGDLGLDQLDQYRRLLGRIGGSEDGVSAGKARKAIDDFVNNAQGSHLSNGGQNAIDLLNQGRKQYQQASKFEDIADILTKADGDPNKIKAGLTRFMNNENNTKGWNDQELQALKDAASGTGTDKLLKMGGKFGFDLGKSLTLGNTIGPVVGGALGGAAAPIAGTAARIGQTLSAKGAAENLLKTLETGGGSIAKTAPVSGLISPVGGLLGKSSATEQLPQQMQPVVSPPIQQPIAPQSSLPDISNFAKAESGNNPNAKNPNSTASGILQFTNRTWGDMVNRYGKQTGIDLADKNNPQAQATMAKLYAQDNIKSLQNTLGRTPSKGELYMAHVLGAQGAAKLINADPNKEAIMLFPRQVFDANRNIFFNGKTPRTSGEVYQILAQKVA